MPQRHLIFAIMLILSACQSTRVGELVASSREESKRVDAEIEYKLHIIAPDSSIQYKILQIQPDSSLTYHILVVKPEP